VRWVHVNADLIGSWRGFWGAGRWLERKVGYTG